MISAPIGHPGSGEASIDEDGTCRPRSAGGAARRRGARLPHARSPRARRSTAPLPDELDPRVRDGDRRAGALRPPARGLGGGRARRAPRGHDRHRVRARRSPSTCRCSTRSRATPKNRALYLYPTKALAQDQFRTLTALPRAAAAAGDLRRRHADRAALADPQVVERDPDEPGHGPRRAAAEPRALGRRAREPALRRRRRGARLPRRLRLARRQRAAAAAPDRARSTAPSRSSCSRRRRSRTRASSAQRAARRARDGDRRRRRAARRAHRRALEPAAARRRARPARLGARGGGEAPGRLRRARPAHAHLREEPQGGRADPPLHGRPARRRLAALALPRRLHAPSSAARSSGGSPRASCSASRRPTRSSSGSTSACSTR